LWFREREWSRLGSKKKAIIGKQPHSESEKQDMTVTNLIQVQADVVVSYGAKLRTIPFI
jgi:hypothetical protein